MALTEEEQIKKYNDIQHICARSGTYIEDYDSLNLEPPKLIDCRTYPTADEYIEQYGFDPNTTCFHCEKDEYGKIIDGRDICNPCNPCINFFYDEYCNKVRTFYMVLDLKSGLYWQHPSTFQKIWDCESDAVIAWESDTPPVTRSKQQLSFYDPHKKKGNPCPGQLYPKNTKESDKLKVKNNFKWCTPMWNDQCRFVVIEFVEDLDADDVTISRGTSMPKCNQEECDVFDSTNRLPRHAMLCKSRCYELDAGYDEHPDWMGNLVNYTHNGW